MQSTSVEIGCFEDGIRESLWEFETRGIVDQTKPRWFFSILRTPSFHSLEHSTSSSPLPLHPSPLSHSEFVFTFLSHTCGEFRFSIKEEKEQAVKLMMDPWVQEVFNSLLLFVGVYYYHTLSLPHTLITQTRISHIPHLTHSHFGECLYYSVVFTRGNRVLSRGIVKSYSHSQPALYKRHKQNSLFLSQVTS
jgi:hypothetical protein